MPASGASSVRQSAYLRSTNLSIRQIFVTDPQFSEEPKLVIIVEDELRPAE